MRMLERLLDEEHIGELDLGAGDDLYKRLWASRRRERVGLVAFDPLTWRGAAGAFRHWAITEYQAHSGSRPQLATDAPECRGPRSGLPWAIIQGRT